MIRITDKAKCCGCTACVTSCPVQCIVMRRDKEGFDYPVANPDLCVNCGKCETVCPVINPNPAKEPEVIYASYSETHRSGSSSGGIFPLIAEKVIAEGGIVFGAALNEDLTVGHASAESLEELQALRGTKYAQSDLYSVFEEVKTCLEEGRKVLFSGTPCQVAGLNNYLGNCQGDLLTIDLACHGVPSPGLWEKYVRALEEKYNGKLKKVNFRDKSRSWRKYEFGFEIFSHAKNSTRYISVPFIKDPYMALFIQGMSLRPSCYECPAKEGRSHSDFTLADFWAVVDLMPQKNDDKGISLVLANTPKAANLMAATGLELTPVLKSDIGVKNGGFKSIIPLPERREEFFKGVESASELQSYMYGYIRRRSFLENFYRRLLKLKRRFIK